MMDWLIFLGKLPFLFIGVSFSLYLAWIIIVGVYGITCAAILKIKDLING